MKNHTDLINYIAEKIQAQTYLEIGVFNPDHNFNHIQVPDKYSVDPDPKAGADLRMTSDKFFTISKGIQFDLIFIDGLHHAEQVKRDIINAWEYLNTGGVIVIHDCNPPTEATTCVPRGAQREWCGDVYKVICQLGPDAKQTVDFDYGCCFMRKWKDDQKLWWLHDEDTSWDDFDKKRKDLLNLISVPYAIAFIDQHYSKTPAHAN
jgi:hypothetical protein